jgi:hypothetical protein
MMDKLNDYFESMVEIPRMKVGERQTIETLINEETLLFAKYLRNEREVWTPRIAISSLKLVLHKEDSLSFTADIL